jgi:hypothetical protein
VGIAGVSAVGVRRRGRFALARLVRVPVTAWYLATGSAGTRPRCPADLAGVLDVLPWRGAQLVAVSGAEVDFVVGAVEVVDEQRLDLLGHRAY